jgi:hypothetical protein
MSSEIIYSEIEQTEALPAPPVSVGSHFSGAASEHAVLFPAGDMDNFRARWRDIQGDFVDEPRKAVEQADELVDQVIQRLADVFASERNKLEKEWGQGKDVSTEDLRQALRRYRSFFDRLLSV